MDLESPLDPLALDAAAPAPPPPPLTYAQSVRAALATLDARDAAALPAAVAASPCLRPALQWSGAVAGLLLAHRALQGGSARSLRSCARDALLGGVATACAQWYQCRSREHDAKLTTRAYYQAQADRQAGRGEFAGSGSGGGGAAAADLGGGGGGGGGGGSGSEAWRRRLQGLEGLK